MSKKSITRRGALAAIAGTAAAVAVSSPLRTEYDIDYDWNGGEPIIQMPASYTMLTPTTTLFAGKRSGHVFGGWYEDPDFDWETTEIDWFSSGDLELYAKWQNARYWDQHMKEKLRQINDICYAARGSSDSFAFITDMHLPDNCLYSFDLIDQVRKGTPVQSVIFGGDAIDWSATEDEAKRILSALHDRLTATGPADFVRGNHDCNDQGHEDDGLTLSNEVFRSIVLGNIDDVTDEKLYYYRDNEDLRIRYFFLDTGHASQQFLGRKQLSWLADHMLELDESWGIVIVLHRYFKIWRNNVQNPRVPHLDTNGKRLNDLIDYLIDDLRAEIICVLSGHCHRDRSLYHPYGPYPDDGGFMAIATTCDAYGQALLWDDAYPNRERGTVEEQAFDVVTIDRDKRKIHLTRIGCGDDRTFSY